MMNREEEEERRRCVTEAMHLMPLDVDYHDGCVVLTILYDIGWLQLYFRQCEEREEIKLLDSSEQQQRILDDYVPTLPCEYQFKFGDVESTNIDSDGRITYFAVPCIIEHEIDEDEILPYDLPPSVSRLQKLQKIKISGCQRIPLELGDLPCLTEITFDCCDRNLFGGNIPVGLQLPHVTCVNADVREFPNCLVPFFNSLPIGLKELCFTYSDKDESNKIISSLQNYELKFCQSLTTLAIYSAEVDDDGFEKLLFEVLPRFPNLRNLSLHGCGIKSLRGAEKKIKELGFVSNNSKLTKLDLRENDIFYNGLIVSSIREFERTKLKKINSIDEKSAALLFLNTFDTISNLGGTLVENQYDPDIEGALRNNLMNRPFTEEGITGMWPSNAALWPFMLETVYNNSWKVYDENFAYGLELQESKMKKKCATELFHMIRYGPIFAVDQYPQHHEITTATSPPATKKQRTKK